MVYVTTGASAGSQTEYGLSTVTTIKNKCNYPIKIIGIQQMYDEEKGYYLQEVSKVMEANYEYNSEQGLMSSIATSMLGMGSPFDLQVQDEYYVKYAYVNAVQWLKIVRAK